MKRSSLALSIIGLTFIPPTGLIASEPNAASPALAAVSSLTTTWSRPPELCPSYMSTGAPLLGNGDMAVCFGGSADQSRFYINRNDFWQISNSTAGTQRLAAVLDMRIPGLKDASYRLDQAISSGIVRGSFKKGTLTIGMTCWLAATDDVMLLELTAQGGETPVEMVLTTPGTPPSTSAADSSGTTAWVVRDFAVRPLLVDIATRAATALRMIDAGGSNVSVQKRDEQVGLLDLESMVVRYVLDAERMRFTLKPGAPVTLAVSTASAFQKANPVELARQRVDTLTLAGIGQLRKLHDQWWAQYWGRSSVELDDPLLIKGYYQGLYTAAAASRNPKFPPGLYGPWITSDRPCYGNDYHLNYNFVAAFYGLYSANRLEQADPQDSPLLDFMPMGRWYAQKATHTRGVLYPVGIGPMGVDVNRGGIYGLDAGGVEYGGIFHQQRSNAAYSLVNIAQRWRCTYDLAYGRKVYPLVLAVVDFWEDYLKFVDGKYQIHGDAIHELSGWNKNPILTLGLLRNAFDLVIDMSQSLNVDVGRRAKWKHILANLADFPIQQRNGKTVFRYTTEGPAWVDGNTLGIQHIYPAGSLTLESNRQLLDVSRNTIAAMDRWFDGNGSNSFFPAAVRVGMDPNIILAKLRRYAQEARPNGFYRDNPHGVENCSTVHNTINEMLCMSVGHALRLFPVWPKQIRAKFTDLRAWDAFLVSAEQKDGVVRDVRIHSEKGRNCVVQNPWPNHAVTLTRNGRKAETLVGMRLGFATKPGEIIVVEPDSGWSQPRK
jgi:alpha-L-fucosidase 2